MFFDRQNFNFYSFAAIEVKGLHALYYNINDTQDCVCGCVWEYVIVASLVGII